jgi:CubicO group peptidase (beta-lactamase class C family)
MQIRINPFAHYLIFAITIFISGCSQDQKNQDSFDERIENGLRPALIYDGNNPTYNISERMQKWGVPAVSIAVIDSMKIIWVGAYGVKNIYDSTPVTTSTLFQSASVSKPVAAVGAASLAYQGLLPLDKDINSLMEKWKIDYSHFKGKVTVRKILSHTAGLGVGGFTGYWPGDSLPGLKEIINGLPPANSPAVKLIEEPDTRFIYSGGGYQVMQMLMEDFTAKTFPEIMSENIFDPLNMDNSFYAPLNEKQKQYAASGHMIGEVIPGYAPVHVESAAGGLWTTPGDLALLLIELMKAYNNESKMIFDSITARSVFTPKFWDYGLGFKVMGEGKNFRFSHGGATTGWHSHIMAFPERGQGVVVMTNGTNGWVLWPEIERAVAHELDWPVPVPRRTETIGVSTEKLDEYAGQYVMGNFLVDISTDSTQLSFSGAGLDWSIVPAKADTFEIVDMEGQVFFRRNKNNDIGEFHLWFGEPDWSPYREWDFVKAEK